MKRNALQKPKTKPTQGEMLKLYAIKNVVSKELLQTPTGEVHYFSSKRQAKITRDQATAYHETKHVVVLGPDHKRAQRKEQPDV